MYNIHYEYLYYFTWNTWPKPWKNKVHLNSNYNEDVFFDSINGNKKNKCANDKQWVVWLIFFLLAITNKELCASFLVKTINI